jgi:hypothetical protein
VVHSTSIRSGWPSDSSRSSSEHDEAAAILRSLRLGRPGVRDVLAAGHIVRSDQHRPACRHPATDRLTSPSTRGPDGGSGSWRRSRSPAACVPIADLTGSRPRAPHLHLGLFAVGPRRCPQPFLLEIYATNRGSPPVELFASGCTF